MYICICMHVKCCHTYIHILNYVPLWTDLCTYACTQLCKLIFTNKRAAIWVNAFTLYTVYTYILQQMVTRFWGQVKHAQNETVLSCRPDSNKHIHTITHRRNLNAVSLVHFWHLFCCICPHYAMLCFFHCLSLFVHTNTYVWLHNSITDYIFINTLETIAILGNQLLLT